MAYDGTLKFDSSMDSSGFQKDTSKLNDIVKGLGIFKVLEAGFKAVASSVGAAVERYDTLEKFPKVLEQMGFSSEDAAKATKKLSDGVQGLPTTLDSVVSTAQRLAVLTGDLDGAVNTTLALNNAFLASGSNSADASRGLEQYVQMLSSGKVDMQSWRTLQETMGYALNETAKSFGFAGESAQNDLYAALRDGDITFKEFNAKIIELNEGVGGFAELAQTASGGIGTAWTNLKTAVVRKTADIISAIDDGLSETRFKSIENIIGTMKDGVVKALGFVADAFGFVAKNADVIAPILIICVSALVAYQVATAAAAVATKILSGAMTANPAAAFAVAIVAVVSAVYAVTVAIRDANNEATELVKSTKALAEQHTDLSYKAWDLYNAYHNNVDSMNESVGATEKMADRLFDLADQTEKTAAEEAKMQVLVDQLNSAIPDLNLEYDKQTGQLNMTEEAVRGLIQAQKDQLFAQANLEAASSAAKYLVEQETLLTQLNAEYQDWVDSLNDGTISQKAFDKGTSDLTERIGQLEKGITTTNGNIDVYLTNAAKFSTATDEASESTAGLATETEEAAKQIEDYAKAYGKTADAVRVEISAMDGDADAWVGQQEQRLRRAQVAEQDYVDAIKAGDIEIVESTANAYEAKRKYGTGLSVSEQAYLDKHKSNIQEQENLIAGYAKTYSMSVEEVKAGIASMGGDTETWAAEQEKALRAAQVAEQDYIAAIKEGTVEITAEEILRIETLRLAGEELGAVEQAKLDRWKAINDQFKAEAEAHTDSIINNFEKLPEKSKLSADKMIKNLQANREQYAQWQANMKEISALVSAETLAELEKLGPGFNSELEKMIANGGEKAKEFDEQVLGAIADGVIHAENTLNEADLSTPAGNMMDTAIQGVEGKEGEFKQAGTDIDSSVGAGMEEGTEASEAAQEIANAVIEDLTSADYSGITAAIAAAITTGTSDVVAAAQSMSADVVKEFGTMKTEATTTTAQMMTDINTEIATHTPTVKASVTALGDGIITISTTTKIVVVAIASQMMSGINTEVTTYTPIIKGSLTTLSNGLITISTTTKTVIVAIANSMMDGINMAITTYTPTLEESASTAASGIVMKLEAMVDGGTTAATNMMAGMLQAMKDNAQDLYDKAQEIANKISATLRAAWQVRSPSRVAYEIMEYYMVAMYDAMEDMEGELYKKTEAISEGITERLSISPEVTASMTERLRAVVDANPFHIGYLEPTAAFAGVPGSTTHSTSLTQYITSPKPLSESELTREAEDLLRRQKNWKLP